MSGQWAVVLTQPNCEWRAEEHLKNQHFETFLPRVRVRKLIKKRLVFKHEPLFRRYIFCRIIDQWRQILGTRGVSSLIMFNERPAIVPEGVINLIRARQGIDGFIALPDTDAPKFKPGQKIKIIGGAFDGHQAIFDCQNGQDRVRALLSLLGSKGVPVVLNEKNIAAA